MFISYAQNFEDVMLWRALKDVKDGFYIDIGSQEPFLYSVSCGFSLNNWQGISVEPSDQFFEKFKMERPRDRILQHFISSKREKVDFYIFPDTGLSTGDEKIARIHKENGFSSFIKKVETITLDDLFNTVGSRDVHWMKIDVEGYEKQVIEGWNKPIFPWILCVESTVPLSREENYDSWEFLIEKKGYRFVYQDGLNRFYLHENHLDLKSYFQYPPNPLQDLYISISHHEIGPVMHRALSAERRANDVEMRLGIIEQEKIQSDNRFQHSENWARDLERQIFEHQKYLENKDHLIEVLNQKLKEQEDRAILAEASAKEQEDRAIRAEKELRKIYGSKSWKITKPLRVLYKILRNKK